MSLLIAAPSSGAGKTTLTLGLLRALKNAGFDVRSAKQGPDFIDPAFHKAATGHPCPNIDTWAMSASRVAALAAGEAPLVIESAMGLFDGAAGGPRGSGEELAETLDLTILLVLDCARVSRSIAAVAAGMVGFNPKLRFGGLLLNRVGSERHETMLRNALARRPDLPPVLGAIRRDARLAHPGRHLGLVQASERSDLETWLETTADLIGGAVDLNHIAALAKASARPASNAPRLPPLGQRIAVARDQAFAFAYPHLLEDWRRAGAEILPFSPLADEGPDPEADAVYLPGGYPELHAGRIAAAGTFIDDMKKAAQNSIIYGECGGYMVLGEGLVDANGKRHAMTGLLSLETSFETPQRHLGYRRAVAEGCALAGHYTAHEFHYSAEVRAEGKPLFAATDAFGSPLGTVGLVSGRIMGSYLHLIDRAA